MLDFLPSFLIFFPLLTLVIVLLLPDQQKSLFKIITLVTTGLQFMGSIIIFINISQSKSATLQFVQKLDWINLDLGAWGKLSIEYFIGVDGLSAGMILLTGIVMFMGSISSWKIEKASKGYFALYLLLSSTIMGCFLAMDFFLFYLFFEFMLLPMYFLIGIWGGERREYAAIKFFLYTLVGSVFILMVMIILYASVIDPQKTAVEMGYAQDANQVEESILKRTISMLEEGIIPKDKQVHTFNFLHLQDSQNYLADASLNIHNTQTWGGLSLRAWAFLALFIGFAIKLPVVPVHTWLPDAHVEAPTPVSVVLAGILLKIGGYGLLRIVYSIFPDMAVEFAWLVGLLGAISIIYGALNALAMSDLKKLVAYSSVSHMGFVLIGIASLTGEGINGAIFQMFSHGVLSALLFLQVGVLYDRTHNRNIGHYQGLLKKMPYFGVTVIISFFASLGLPGFSGFIGELFTLLGAFASPYLSIWIGVVSVFGIVLGAAYFLWTLQRMFLGVFGTQLSEKDETQLTDLDRRESFMLITLIAIAFVLGILPNLFFNSTDATVIFWLETFFKPFLTNL